MNSHVSVPEFTGLCGQIGVLYTHVYTGVYTRVYSGSEHVQSRGSIHVVPFVNSRYSVDKLGVQILFTLVQNTWNPVFQLVQFMFYRT